MKFIDMFSGIGGFRTAMENNGHECIAYSEIDKYAKQSYQAMYDTENEIDLGDITNISQEYLSHFKKDNDMVVGGSPCQAFSIAGKQAGFEDTRGTLFFEYAKVVKETQPKYFLFENVKGMLSHDKGNTIRVVLETFNELGYYIDFNVFNSKYYGVPQNRERIYILGKRKDLVEQPKYHDKTKGKKKFDEIHNWAVDNINYVELLPPLQTEVTTRLIDVLEDEVDEKYYLSDEKTKKLTLDNDLGGKLNMYDFNERDKVHSVNKVSPTLNTTSEPKIAINQLGNIVDNKETFGGNPQRGRVYSSIGLSPALNSMRGGGLEPKVAVLGNTSNTGHRSQNIHDIDGISPTIAARDYKGAKKIAVPVLTPDRLNKRQNGRRFKEDGEPMFTLTSQDRHGIAIREATKQGYAIAEQGDSVNVSYPTSKTRRGRVGKQVAQTLQAGEVNQGVVMNDIRIRKLVPIETWRLQGFTDEQFYKAKDSGVSNSQLYKQSGNAITISVADAIIKKITEG